MAKARRAARRVTGTGLDDGGGGAGESAGSFWRLAAAAWSCAMAACGCAALLLPPFFSTNDDAYAQLAMTGRLAADATGRIPFIGFPIAWAASKLGSLWPDVPWWALFLGLFVAASLAVAGETLLRETGGLRRFREAQGAPAVLLGLFALDLGLGAWAIGRLQFTFSASLMVGAGMLTCLVCTVRRERVRAGRLAGPVALFLLGALLRKQSAQIALVFWAVALAALTLGENGKFRERMRGAADAWKLFGVVALLTLAVLCVKPLAYSGPWSDVVQRSAAFSAYVDYPEPTYDEDPQLYESVGWDRELAELAPQWFMMDARETTDAFTALVAGRRVAVERLLADPAGALKARTSDLRQPIPTTHICLFAGLTCLAYLCAQGRRGDKALIWATSLLTGGLLAYLVVLGRLPDRAAYSVLLPGDAVLGALCLVRGGNWWRARRGGAEVRPGLGAVALGTLCLVPVAGFGLTSGAMSGAAALAGAALCAWLIAAGIRGRWTQDNEVDDEGAHANGQERGIGGAQAVRQPAGRAHAVVLALPVFLIGLLLLSPGAAALQQYNRYAGPYAAQSERMAAAEAFYDYAEAHPKTLFVYSYDADLTPQDAGRTRWPINQTTWGGWRFFMPWYDAALKKAGFRGQPVSADLLRDDVRFVSGSDTTTDLMRRYLEGRYGPVTMTAEKHLRSGVTVYRIQKAG